MAFVISWYLVIAIVCAIFLAVILFMGGMDFDADVDLDADVDVDVDVDADIGHGPSPFSIPVLMTALTFFGVFGTLFESMGWDPYQVPVMALICAVVIGGIAYYAMYKVFRWAEGGTKLKYKDLLGLKATVSIPIQNGDEGQIVVTPKDTGRTLVPAISDDDVQRDEVVRIIEIIGDKVKVKRLGPERKRKKGSIPRKDVE